MTTRPWPWDSPAVRKRSTPKRYRSRGATASGALGLGPEECSGRPFEWAESAVVSAKLVCDQEKMFGGRKTGGVTEAKRES